MSDEKKHVDAATASTWCWEKGHQNPRDAWSESLRENAYLGLFDKQGEPIKHINPQGDKAPSFIGYHSFKNCGRSLFEQIANAGIAGMGSVHLYALIGGKLYATDLDGGLNKKRIDAINAELRRLNGLDRYNVVAMRKNLPGKPDYEWRWIYTNGKPVAVSLEVAEAKKDHLDANMDVYQLYDVRVIRSEDH